MALPSCVEAEFIYAIIVKTEAQQQQQQKNKLKEKTRTNRFPKHLKSVTLPPTLNNLPRVIALFFFPSVRQ